MLDDRNLRIDLLALGVLALTVFLTLSLLTYSPADPLGEALFPLNLVYHPDALVYPPNTEIQNACGRAGAWAADILLQVFGLGAYYVLLCLAVLDIWLLVRRPIQGASIRLAGWLASLLGAVTMLAMFAPGVGSGPVIGPGGYLGALGRTLLESHFATAGSVILLVSLMVGGLLLCTDYVLLHVVLLAATALINMMPSGRFHLPGRLRLRWPRRRKKATWSDGENEYADEESTEEDEVADETMGIRIRGRRVDDLTDPDDLVADADEDQRAEEPEDASEEDEVDEFEDELEDDDEEGDEEADVEMNAPAIVPLRSVSAGAAEAGTNSGLRESSTGSEREAVMAQLDEASREQDVQDYDLPPIDLLLQSESYSVAGLKREVQRKAAILEKTFQDFSLDVRVVDIETGPVIAQYEVELKRGLRLSKITGLADDLAIALRVPSVRIVAPIPGKNTVGIEVPNDERQIVRLREVMEETNSRVKRMSIPVFLGKDVSGNPLAVDLASLPHLLIAGRTGTGKSVCLNAIISSILMTKTPDDVRMLMIDPKMVELSGYARLPHLMHPVVTDMRKAEAILAWACEKMDERYQLLARAGVRHVSVYNELGEEELMDRLQPETDEERKSIPRHLPFIVIVADEMADLMMTAGKEVEAHIIRLAAKSRAVGIHLILATQKPTVDVITGLIKSNLPARIAFQVASRTDSRVVLDEMGADKLLGHGDMLFLWPGTSTLLRGQGTFLSDDEIAQIVDYCGSNGEQNFVRELVQLKVEPPADTEATSLKKRDELYEGAIDVVVREGRGSVSLLQRNLQIGYGRAARLIDFMAEDGIVGAYNGSQAREVLVTLHDWHAMQSGGATATASTDGPRPTPGQHSVGAVVARNGTNVSDDEIDREEEDCSADELEEEIDEADSLGETDDLVDDDLDEEEYLDEEDELNDEIEDDDEYASEECEDEDHEDQNGAPEEYNEDDEYEDDEYEDDEYEDDEYEEAADRDEDHQDLDAETDVEDHDVEDGNPDEDEEISMVREQRGRLRTRGRRGNSNAVFRHRG